MPAGIPKALGDLGISDEELSRHIGLGHRRPRCRE